ncbi:MAG TPA: 2-dehydropantoate 2-reductase N-terminal domain-containing protein, partial [Ramlibacter sp.]|nr:2-dehydropantoate 2-reductase N-terminal domain-containing protein [Ramlibacter sp.]
MRICVYGLGAIGGLLAGRLAIAGAHVSAVARGATLQAVRERGLTLIDADGARLTAPILVSDKPADLGPQDLVIVALKTSALPGAAHAIASLLGPETSVLSAMNGVPWWFFHGLPDAPGGLRLE